LRMFRSVIDALVPRTGQSSLTVAVPGSLGRKNPYSCLFYRSSLVGISAFYVSFKYYHAPVGAQLNRNATSILRQMQGEHRDKESSERHAQERKGCGQGCLPQLWDLSLPNRQGLERLLGKLKLRLICALILRTF
jgi:hypothetical protein